MEKVSLILRLLDKAKEEVKNFELSEDPTFLMQGAEKIYVAYTLLLEKIVGGELTSHQEIRNFSRFLGKKDRVINKLYKIAEILHSYHYEGRIDPELIKKDILLAITLIKNKLKVVR